MKNGITTSRISIINKIFVCCILVFVSSCEDLTDSLSPRDNITDTWKCLETDSTNGSDSFLIDIEADNSSLSGIRIYNFNHLGENFFITATVRGSSISISNQTKDGFTISGSGTIKSGYEEITLKYSVNDGGGVENYNAVCTKP